MMKTAIPEDVVLAAVKHGLNTGIFDLTTDAPTHDQRGKKLTPAERLRWYERRETAWKILCNTEDDGRFGKAREIGNASLHSVKTTVSRAGKIDNYVAITFAGKTRPVMAESKTGGAELDNLPKKGYVLYSNFTAKQKTCKWQSGDRFQLQEVIVPADLFRALIEYSGAIYHDKLRTRGGRGDSIQPSNKYFNCWLGEFAPLYEPGKTYSLEDFAALYDLLEAGNYPRGSYFFRQKGIDF